MRVQLMAELPHDSLARLGSPTPSQVSKETVNCVTADDGRGCGKQRRHQVGVAGAQGIECTFEDVGNEQKKHGSHGHRENSREIADALSGSKILKRSLGTR